MVSSIDASEHASKKVQEKGTAALFNATAPFFLFTCYGAGEENRTLDASLGSSRFAIKLHPQNFLAYYTPITNSRQTFWFDGCAILINSTTISYEISYA